MKIVVRYVPPIVTHEQITDAGGAPIIHSGEDFAIFDGSVPGSLRNEVHEVFPPLREAIIEQYRTEREVNNE
ncbi:MAG: hypothetical protein WC373_15160 [Smithella sp.]|jgi:hypothetical protein